MMNDNNTNTQNKTNDDDYIVPLTPTGPFEPMPNAPFQVPKPEKKTDPIRYNEQ
jgi:hypothetical protein